MKKTQLKNSLLLLLTATIWGVAFVAQSVGMDHVGPFTFNAVRNIIGGIVLIPCIFFLDHRKSAQKEELPSPQQQAEQTGTLILGGVCCGILLALASSFQQMGIQYTTVGRAGFITACYIVIGSDSWPFLSEEKMRRHHLDRCCTCTGRTVSALHHRRFFRWKRGSAGHGMFPAVFLTYSGNRLFFAQG